MYQCYICGSQYNEYQIKCSDCGDKLTIVHSCFPLSFKKKGVSAKDINMGNQDYYQIAGFEFLGDFVKNERISLAVYGAPGSGKSSFLLSFANTISKKGSKSLYIAAEEGRKSATFRKKLEIFSITNPFLFFEDKLTVPEIIEKVSDLGVKNLFIDSVSSMRLKPSEGRYIKDKLNAGFVAFLLHSTKDGKYKGGTDWIHDCDVEIKAETGIARTIKNRYGEPKEQRIFPGKILSECDNGGLHSVPGKEENRKPNKRRAKPCLAGLD
jgi:predicted ATP-dependent serine protease